MFVPIATPSCSRGNVGGKYIGSGDSGAADLSLGDAVDRHLQALFEAHGDRLPPDGMYDRVISEVERPLLALALGATRDQVLQVLQAAQQRAGHALNVKEQMAAITLPGVAGFRTICPFANSPSGISATAE